LYASEKNGIERGGALKPRIGCEWPLEGVSEALMRITSVNTTAKLLIRV